MEPLFVSNDLDGDTFARPVVTTLQNLAKRSLAEEPKNLIPVCKVITEID